MNVELLQNSSLEVVVKAIRKCYSSEGNSDSILLQGEYVLGARDIDLLQRILSSGHHSTIEHMNYSFNIDGISRGCLQELARHRISSFSVQSTRYTLGKQLKAEEAFDPNKEESQERAKKYLVVPNNPWVFTRAIQALEEVRQGAISGIPNDQLKYALPESYKTSLVWTINARSLRNFLQLRSSPGAHWEIRKLAEMIIQNLPQSHLVLFQVLK